MEYGTGLQILPEDKEDLRLGAVFGVVEKADLPEDDFDLAPTSPIKNQGKLDFCASFAATSISGDQEDVELDELWQFAQAKEIRGEYKSWGCDLRSIGLSMVKVGSIKKSDAPFDMTKPRDFLANWENYPAELKEKAKEHKKNSMWFVDGPYDTFDNIRSALHQAYMAKSHIDRSSLIAGTMWRYSWNASSVVPGSGWENDRGEGHAIKIRGQKKINGEVYLKVQNSWGRDIGETGIFYFPRKVVNDCFGPYGQIAFKDMTVEEGRYLQQNGIKKGDNWVVALLKTLYTLFVSVLHI